jgi:hypothetical protein
MEKSDLEVELMMSSLYFIDVFKGLDTKKTAELGWYLPKKTILCQPSSLLQDPNLINKQLEDLPGQYYLLKNTSELSYCRKGRLGSNCPFQKNQITTTQRYF